MPRVTQLSVLAFLALLFGCASSHVLIGVARPPISPSQVKLYLRPPAKYEEVAILDASSRGSFAITDQGKMDKAITRLKEEAAKLGANGILLQGTGGQYGGSVNTGGATATANGNTAYGVGSGVSVPVFLKAANGLAIFVSQE